MIYTVENDYLSLSVKEVGAELCSIKSKSSGCEYMWGADPNVWGNSAPVLFPIIGVLKDGICRYNGREYKIPKHGVVRGNKDMKLYSKTDTSLKFMLSYSEETLELYPFKFRIFVSFTLNNSVVVVDHHIENLGDDKMLFSIGGHPAFKVPFNDGERYDDYFLEFEKSESSASLVLSRDGLVCEEEGDVISGTKIALTKNLFDNDALIFDDLESRSVSLRNSHNSQKLTVSYPKFSYLGVWAKPGADFVCIEPWIGISDYASDSGALEDKKGMITLQKGESFSGGFEIEISED